MCLTILWGWRLKGFKRETTEVYLGYCQTSMVEFFSKRINGMSHEFNKLEAITSTYYFKHMFKSFAMHICINMREELFVFTPYRFVQTFLKRYFQNYVLNHVNCGRC